MWSVLREKVMRELGLSDQEDGPRRWRVSRRATRATRDAAETAVEKVCILLLAATMHSIRDQTAIDDLHPQVGGAKSSVRWSHAAEV